MNKAQQLQKQAGSHIHTANKAAMYYDCWLNGSWCIKKNDKKFEKLDKAIDKAIAGNWAELQELLKKLW